VVVLRNPVPVTVSVSELEPAMTEVGLMELTVGAPVVPPPLPPPLPPVLLFEEPPPPQPAIKRGKPRPSNKKHLIFMKALL
jgi:hypothetical protein